jgi:hypothetical protein
MTKISQGYLIDGTKFIVTKISLFERLKFRAHLIKEGLKTRLGTKMMFGSICDRLETEFSRQSD